MLKAPAGVESVGTEAGVLEVVDGLLALPDDAVHRALAMTLVRHSGFVMVAG